MHEVSIMEQTLEIAINKAKNQGAKQIYNLKMRIGAVSGVVPEALTFAFDVITDNTIAQGAKLEIETVPVKCYCSHCQQDFYPSDLVIYECPQCGQFSHKIITGKEIELTSLEVA